MSLTKIDNNNNNNNYEIGCILSCNNLYINSPWIIKQPKNTVCFNKLILPGVMVGGGGKVTMSGGNIC